jgi:hypothetical protein
MQSIFTALLGGVLRQSRGSPAVLLRFVLLLVLFRQC